MTPPIDITLPSSRLTTVIIILSPCTLIKQCLFFAENKPFFAKEPTKESTALVDCNNSSFRCLLQQLQRLPFKALKTVLCRTHLYTARVQIGLIFQAPLLRFFIDRSVQPLQVSLNGTQQPSLLLCDEGFSRSITSNSHHMMPFRTPTSVNQASIDQSIDQYAYQASLLLSYVEALLRMPISLDCAFFGTTASHASTSSSLFNQSTSYPTGYLSNLYRWFVHLYDNLYFSQSTASSSAYLQPTASSSVPLQLNESLYSIFSQTPLCTASSAIIDINQSTMDPTKKKTTKPIIPPIPLKEDSENKPEFIKHSRTETHNNVSESVEERILKIGDESTPYQLLQFLTAFSKARTNLQWITGPVTVVML